MPNQELQPQTPPDTPPLVLPDFERERILSLLPPEKRDSFLEKVARGDTSLIAELEQILVRERAGYNTRSSTLITLGVITICGGVCLILSYPTLLAPVFCAFGFAYCWIEALLKKRDSSLEWAAMDGLFALRDKRVIGPLLEQLRQGTEADRKRVRQSLAGMLPLLREGDADQLTGTQRGLLYDCITSLYIGNPEFTLAAINVLERIGDKHSLVPLYAVAARSAATKREQTRRTAAQKCLYDLQSRLDFGDVTRIPGYLTTFYGTLGADDSFRGIDAVSLYALLHLVPKLTLTNYNAILDQKDKSRLYNLLHPAAFGVYAYGQQPLCREIIQTLVRVQDTQALPTLRQVASIEAPTDGEKQLRSAAREAIRELKVHLEKQKESMSLLRGSSAPGTLPSELLRPALPSASTTEPGELLRAAAAPADSKPSEVAKPLPVVSVSAPEPPTLSFPRIKNSG